MFHRMMNYGEMEAKPMVVLTRDIIKKFMPKYKRHDDLIIVQEHAWEEFKKSLPIPVARDENSPFSVDEDELACLVCQVVQKPTCRRLAVEKTVKNDDYRSPNIELILGDSKIVNHKENHITYQFDLTKCMFSFGNINEKMRMGDLDCSNEIVVDLFAGIGYFSLPLLIHAKAKHLYACEWNPDSIEAFKNNLTLNKVDTTRCTVIEGDNRSNRPTDVAQRVILGILPSSLEWMQTAFECIDKTTGAILHCHDLVETPLKQSSNNSHENSNSSQLDKQTSCNVKESSLNQSFSSSSSSHSTIERLMAPSEEKSPVSESDKETSSPVFLEKPSGSSANTSLSPPQAVSSSNSHNDTSSISSHHEENSTHDPPPIEDHEMNVYETRAQILIDRLKEDVESHDMIIRLRNIQPVKSYAPHVNHVVFDISIEPK